MNYKELKGAIDEISKKSIDYADDPNTLSMLLLELSSLNSNVNENYAKSYYNKLDAENRKKDALLSEQNRQLAEGESATKARFWAELASQKPEFDLRKIESAYKLYQRLHDTCEKLFEAIRSRLSVIKKEMEKYGAA